LGGIVIVGAAILVFIAFASMNVAANELGDAFVGHVSKHTIRYLIIAAAALVSGMMIVVFGSPHGSESAR
jgi:hypothetical protein